MALRIGAVPRYCREGLNGCPVGHAVDQTGDSRSGGNLARRTDLEHSMQSVPRNAAECRGEPVGKDGQDAQRVTTTLTRRQKAELDRIAKAQGVKVAWLVRRAVERLLEEASGGPMLPFDFGEQGEDVKR